MSRQGKARYLDGVACEECVCMGAGGRVWVKMGIIESKKESGLV